MLFTSKHVPSLPHNFQHDGHEGMLDANKNMVTCTRLADSSDDEDNAAVEVGHLRIVHIDMFSRLFSIWI